MDGPCSGIDAPRPDVGATVQTDEPSTMKVTTIGLDPAKNVFQVHGADAEGRSVFGKKLHKPARHDGLIRASLWMGYRRINPFQKPCED